MINIRASLKLLYRRLFFKEYHSELFPLANKISRKNIVPRASNEAVLYAESFSFSALYNALLTRYKHAKLREFSGQRFFF